MKKATTPSYCHLFNGFVVKNGDNNFRRLFQWWWCCEEANGNNRSPFFFFGPFGLIH